MSKRNFECYHFNGYTGVCDLKGGECHRCCKEWISEEQYFDSIGESDTSVSIAQVRLALEENLRHHILHSKIDDIINQLKRKLI